VTLRPDYQFVMTENEETAGRFLPARVYRRWKWAVRFGLLIVSSLVFLSGGLVLFFKTDKYESKALVEIENARSPQESANLLESSGILGRVVREKDLVRRWGVDTETAVSILKGNVEVKVVPDTRLLDISVILAEKDLARDIAAALPQSLASFEKAKAAEVDADKLAKLDQLIRSASDVAAEKTVAVTKIEKFHSVQAPDESAVRELERARRASLVADAEVERLQVLRADAASGSIGGEPRLIVHSAPVISQNPVNPNVSPELNALALQALLGGLLTALLLPYLLELAFPPQGDREILSDLVENM
jgi:hypothetical protein